MMVTFTYGKGIGEFSDKLKSTKVWEAVFYLRRDMKGFFCYEIRYVDIVTRRSLFAKQPFDFTMIFLIRIYPFFRLRSMHRTLYLHVLPKEPCDRMLWTRLPLEHIILNQHFIHPSPLLFNPYSTGINYAQSLLLSPNPIRHYVNPSPSPQQILKTSDLRPCTTETLIE